MYTKEEEIIHYIFKAFKGLKRKKEDIELCFHSIMVGNMLKNIGKAEIDTFYNVLNKITNNLKENLYEGNI